MRQKNQSSQTERPPVDDRPPSTDLIRISDFGGELIEYRCGHMYWSAFSIDIYGSPTHLDYIGNAPDERPCCGVCALLRLKDRVIRCARCGHAILAGDLILAYLRAPEMIIDRCTVIPATDPPLVAGCTYHLCRTSEAIEYGYWLGDGKFSDIQTALRERNRARR